MSNTENISKETEDFETKLKNAKKTLETLMNPEITLEESVKAYEKGTKELLEAQKILEEAVLKINTIKAS